MKKLVDIKKENLKGKKVLLRASLNVPVTAGKIDDAYRLDRSRMTIEYLLAAGAKIIMIGHIAGDESYSLKVVFEYYKKKHYKKIKFVEDLFMTDYSTIFSADDSGEIVLAENIRRYKQEKENDYEFSKQLAALADFYVNDAFAVSHRDHASVTGVCSHIPSYAGLLLEQEIIELSKVFTIKEESLLILGGAKFSTKIPLAKEFISNNKQVFVAGALMNEFFQDMHLNLGKSLTDEKEYHLEEIISKDNLHLPEDLILLDSKTETNRMSLPAAIKEDEIAVDIGPLSLENLLELVEKAKLVIWNGPLGNYEIGYSANTETLARALAKTKAYTIIGGGDTLAVTGKLNITDKFDFVSTGGGAMLDFLKDRKSVGIEALNNNVI